MMKTKKTAPRAEQWRVLSATIDRGFLKQVDDFCYERDIARSALVEYALARLLAGKDPAALDRLAKRIKAAGGDRTSRRNRYSAP